MNNLPSANSCGRPAFPTHLDLWGGQCKLKSWPDGGIQTRLPGEAQMQTSPPSLQHGRDGFGQTGSSGLCYCIYLLGGVR
jgi:hypothetical protein